MEADLVGSWLYKLFVEWEKDYCNFKRLIFTSQCPIKYIAELLSGKTDYMTLMPINIGKQKNLNSSSFHDNNNR